MFRLLFNLHKEKTVGNPIRGQILNVPVALQVSMIVECRLSLDCFDIRAYRLEKFIGLNISTINQVTVDTQISFLPSMNDMGSN